MEYLAGHGPSSVRGLARSLDVPLGSAHRLLTALRDEGVVERTRDDEWGLSYRLLGIAGQQLARLELPAIARPVLDALAARSGSTAFLAVRSGTDVVYLDKVQTQAQVQLYVELGARRPMHSTALGKAILAFGPEAARADYIAATALTAITAITAHTVTEPAALHEQLAGFRAQGYATDKHEAVLGVCCLAVPVFDVGGRVAGAVSVAGADPRLADEDPTLVSAVCEAGRAISGRLGGNGPDQ